MEQEVKLIYPLIRMPVSEIPCFVINLILDCIKPFFCAVIYFRLIYPREKAFSGNIFNLYSDTELFQVIYTESSRSKTYQLTDKGLKFKEWCNDLY